MGTFEQHPQVVALHKDVNDAVVTVIFRANKHETTQNTRKGNTFYCVLGNLSSCDHLDLEKSPSVRETNGTAAGSRYIGRSDRLQSFGYTNCSKVRPSISTLLCIHLRWCWFRSEPDNILYPFSFFCFFFLHFLSFHSGQRH